MTDIEIKTLIKKRGANMSDIARVAQVTPGAVRRVIEGKDKSRRIATIISNFLGQPLEKLWPGLYPDTYRRRSSEQVMRELHAAAANLQRHMEAA